MRLLAGARKVFDAGTDGGLIFAGNSPVNGISQIEPENT